MAGEKRLSDRIKTGVLLLFVTGVAIQLGGSLYSSRVVETLWVSDPPASMQEWGPVVQLAGERFFRMSTPLVGLLALLTLATSFGTAWRHRWWRLAAAVCFLAALVWTILYFVPTAMMLTSAALDTMTAAEATEAVETWVKLDDLRMLLILGALILGIRALFVPAAKTTTT